MAQFFSGIQKGAENLLYNPPCVRVSRHLPVLAGYLTSRRDSMKLSRQISFLFH